MVTRCLGDIVATDGAISDGATTIHEWLGPADISSSLCGRDVRRFPSGGRVRPPKCGSRRSPDGHAGDLRVVAPPMRGRERTFRMRAVSATEVNPVGR